MSHGTEHKITSSKPHESAQKAWHHHAMWTNTFKNGDKPQGQSMLWSNWRECHIFSKLNYANLVQSVNSKCVYDECLSVHLSSVCTHTCVCLGRVFSQLTRPSVSLFTKLGLALLYCLVFLFTSLLEIFKMRIP